MKPDETENITSNQPTQTKYVIPKPGLIPLKQHLSTIAKNDITGIWKPENNDAKYYYKIVKGPLGSIVQLWSNGKLEATGKVWQKDSNVKISYENERFGEIMIQTILSADGKKMQGSKTLGTKMKSNISLAITLEKAE